MTPRAASYSRQNCTWVLRPKPENHPHVVLRSKPPNYPRLAYSIHVPCDLNMCHRRSLTTLLPSPPAPLLDLLDHHLDPVNTVNSAMYTCSCRCLQVLATTASHLASLVPRSQPDVHPSLLPVHRHESTWLSPSPSTTASELYICAPQAKRHVAQHHTHTMVSSQTQPKPIVSFTITHHTWTLWAHINHVFAISPLMSGLSTPNTKRWIKSKRKTEKSFKWPKAS
jgi:hypothetical protein